MTLLGKRTHDLPSRWSIRPRYWSDLRMWRLTVRFGSFGYVLTARW